VDFLYNLCLQLTRYWLTYNASRGPSAVAEFLDTRGRRVADWVSSEVRDEHCVEELCDWCLLYTLENKGLERIHEIKLKPLLMILIWWLWLPPFLPAAQYVDAGYSYACFDFPSSVSVSICLRVGWWHIGATWRWIYLCSGGDAGYRQHYCSNLLKFLQRGGPGTSSSESALDAIAGLYTKLKNVVVKHITQSD